jgi:branched-chain amino acid transport system substrate-binding protein
MATQRKTLMIVLASAPALTAKDSKFVLRPIGRDDRLAATAATYLKTNFWGKNVGALSSETSTGIGALLRAATNVQFPLKLFETVKPDSSDLDWANKVDVLVAAGIGPPLLDRIVRQNDRSSIVLVTNVMLDQHYAALAASRGAVAIANPNASLFPDAKAAVESGKKQGMATTGYFIYAYAGVQIFANLAKKAGNMSGDALAEAGRKEQVPSLLGPLKFDASGDLVDWHFALFSGGPEGTVKPLDLAAVDLCKTDQCSQLDYCKPCPNN